MRASLTLSYCLISLLFCSVLFADFIPSTLFGSYADQRVLLVLSLSLLAVIGLTWSVHNNALTVSVKALWPFLFFSFSLLIAAFQNRSGPYSLVEPVFFILYFVAFGLIGDAIGRFDCARKYALAVVTVAIVACFFYAAMSVTVYLFAITDDSSRLDQLIPWGFFSIRYWSHIATWLVPLFPLALLCIPWNSNRTWRWGVASTAAIWWWIIFLSSSRGSMFGLVFCFLLIWGVFGKSSFPWMKLFARFAIYGLLVWFLLSVLIPSFVFDEIHVRGIKTNSSGRLSLWHEAWIMSLEKFPFGMGPQSWLTHDILTETYRSSSRFGHPHNMYLMWAAEYGWIAIGGLLILVGVALRRLWHKIKGLRNGDHHNGFLLVGFTASVTAALVHAGASAVFMAPGSMLVGLPVLCVFWALISPYQSTVPVSSARQKFVTSTFAGYAIVIVFAAACMLWFQDVLDYRQAMADDIPYYQEEVRQGKLPRFWLHGNFPRHQSQMSPES
ncbi:MAG: type 4 pilus glycosylase [Marinobacter sp. HL-58]|nr:MAG: type 4 pilus glycosylase [Marinobacter sp. HL-58]